LVTEKILKNNITTTRNERKEKSIGKREKPVKLAI
jgi:hypothetical protein